MLWRRVCRQAIVVSIGVLPAPFILHKLVADPVVLLFVLELHERVHALETQSSLIDFISLSLILEILAERIILRVLAIKRKHTLLLSQLGLEDGVLATR